MSGSVPLAVARLDPQLEAVLTEIAPLEYFGGGRPSDDLPPHVRGASGVCRDAGSLVVVQDDVLALAVRDVRGAVAARLLPAGEGGVRVFDESRANKHLKLDLEACARLPEPDARLVLFGSGSLPARERLVVVDRAGAARVFDASALYAQLRADTAFSGSELNVEGAVVDGQVVRLFQRGNGAPRGDLEPVDATIELALSEFVAWLDGARAAPAPTRAVQYDLGRVRDVRFGFTDAARLDDGRIAFLACAEASPDAVADGEVLGCRFGLIDGDDVRTADVVDGDGRAVRLKLEGLAPRPGEPLAFDVVIDMDRGDEPARIGVLRARARAAPRD